MIVQITEGRSECEKGIERKLIEESNKIEAKVLSEFLEMTTRKVEQNKCKCKRSNIERL